jgi:hypothetical protein
MKMQEVFIRTVSHDDALSAWHEQVVAAAHDAKVTRQLIYREWEVLPRFAEHFRKLKALPRRARRGLQRKWKQSLAGVALLLALGQTPAPAATFNVANGDVAGLIAAINAANANGESDIIALAANGTLTLIAVNSDFSGPTGVRVITSRIVMNGNRARIQRANNAPAFRMFAVDGTSTHGGDLTVRNTIISGGLTGPGQAGGSLLTKRAILRSAPAPSRATRRRLPTTFVHWVVALRPSV